MTTLPAPTRAQKCLIIVFAVSIITSVACDIREMTTPPYTLRRAAGRTIHAALDTAMDNGSGAVYIVEMDAGYVTATHTVYNDATVNRDALRAGLQISELFTATELQRLSDADDPREVWTELNLILEERRNP